ncbi:hypothetical protein HHL17_15095 [Chitinophaga sp. G-6-1-13]|uniref:Uncharacterized protein n=1 Tax=Chitinophaga fulva TaxID=2728842 RepID=A0A848GJG0_9BACT|nr:hypothetical protein [Chitinophaga fulva]NML38534.1 hypothetical protein [Chitinophaga fulva]
MTYRIDFRGPEQTMLYTAVCNSTLEVETLLRQVLQYDWSDEKGTYAMTLYDLSSGEEQVVHVYCFKMEPPYTKAAFEAVNNRS